MKNKYTRVSLISPFAGAAIAFAMLLTSCQKDINPAITSGEEEINSNEVFVGNAPGTAYEANQVLLQFKSGVNPEIKSQIYGRIGARLEERIYTAAMESAGVEDGVYLINTPLGVFESIELLKAMPEIEFAEPNYIYTHFATSNDLYYANGSLWGMYGDATSPANAYGSQAGEAWANNHTGSSDVIVAVIDEGIMNTHKDLAANCWINSNDPVDGIDNDGNGYKDDKWGWDFAGNNNTTYDGSSDDHATHVAGTIGGVGNNGIGVAGVNWNIKMISCKFLGSSGGSTANAIKAVDYVTDLKARHSLNIVATNNSWGGGGFSQGLKDAIDRANAKEILFIAAAGNNGTNNDVTASYPSNYTSSNIIAVAALTSTGALASYSQYGATTVDIGAPGSGIYSTLPTRKSASTYGSYNGTSMATPHVTGAAALYAASNPGSSAAIIKAAILNSAIPTSSLTGKCVTNGRLNVSGF